MALGIVGWFQVVKRISMLPIVCFTPQQDCTAALVNRIAKVKNALYIQAYSFTSKSISQAVVDAQKRGVDVRFIVDKTQFDCQHFSIAGRVLAAGVNSRVDVKPIIAHNKIMIGDHRWVETGSFNFTFSAQHRNAENMVFLFDSHSIQAFNSNFLERWKQSVPIIQNPCHFKRYNK